MESFETYLQAKDNFNQILGDGYFAYEMSCRICEQSVDENPAEGREHYLQLLKSIIKSFIDLITKNKTSDLETKIKAHELKKFILGNMIEELIVLITRNFGVTDIQSVTTHS